MKADRQLTEQRQFVEKRSYVTKDQREVLTGLDWQRRLQQLRNRCQGRCEYIFKTADGEEMRCARPAADPHHLRLRSKGRDDRMENLLAVCRHHHQILDAIQRKERVKR